LQAEARDRSSGDARLSVALVTRNRPSSLERTLRSLRAQTTWPHEVVVSDDSDDADVAATREVVERYSARYLSGPRRGLYANRNAAAVACMGTHIHTMDDDHEFPVDHFAHCIEAATAEPESVWTIGEHLAGRPQHGKPPFPGEIGPRGFTVPPRDPHDSRAIADGSTIYPRSIFDRGVRYSEAFSFGPVYLELGCRIRELGYTIRWLESTHVVHHFDPAARSVDDPETVLAARIFAMLCLVNRYEPSLRGRALCSVEIAYRLARAPRTAVPALRRGFAAYCARRSELAVAR
jgi:glycosyltransferase involved in cell wall biosynthesis